MPVVLVVVYILLTAAIVVFLCWALVRAEGRNRQLEVDNYRLIRRLGHYHSLTLGPDRIPDDFLRPDPSPVPPAFKMRQPLPPT